LSFADALRRRLYEPRVRDADVDDPAFLSVHAAILKEKKLLRSAFETFYRDMMELSDRFLNVSGTEIELGTGAGFFKTLRPGLVTSDVRRGPNIDKVIDAQSMDLPDSSVRCIYAINVFHHLPQPDKFIGELCRVLHPGGGCILIEPHGGFGSATLHRRLHKDEHFDPSAASWSNLAIGGPMSDANQALAHIVFKRDLDQFNKKYGDRLEVVYQKYSLNSLRYFFSGGLNFRQLLPSMSDPILKAIEVMAQPLARHWSFHQVTVIRRRP
jgi:SAM-dependent methyltransferase